MNLATKDGPFREVTRTNNTFVGKTTTNALLAWGRSPKGFGSDRCGKTLVSRLAKIPKRLEWYGISASKELFEQDGWPEGLAVAERFRASLPSFQMKSRARRRSWRIDGDEFDRDRFDAGREDCWSRRERSHAPGRPVLRLTCAIGGHSGKSASELCWSGAAAFAICDAAEAAGYRLEIDAISAVRDAFVGKYELAATVIQLKEADDPLNREVAVMGLSSPAFFRWNVINSRLCMVNGATLDDGSGVTVETPSFLRGDLHMQHCYSSSAAAESVSKAIKAIEAMAEATKCVA